jgi:hypothetical protein
MVVITEKGFGIEDNHVLGNEDYFSLVRTEKEQRIVPQMYSLETHRLIYIVIMTIILIEPGVLYSLNTLTDCTKRIEQYSNI